MAKERIEDLGRLAVLLNCIAEHGIFDHYSGRTKDYPEWFESQPKEKQYELLHDIAYALRDINHKLCECVVIARGHEE